MRDLDWRSAVRLVLPAFVAGKAISLLVAYLAVWYDSPNPGLPNWTELRVGLSTWDGTTYHQIADEGYPPGPLSLHAGDPSHLWGFFPGLPIAAKVLSVFFVDVVLSGILFNMVCELVALVFLARLVKLERGDDCAAVTAVWLLALYPYAIYLTVMYTEAPFLAAATASLYWMRRGEHARACVAGALAMAFRLTAIALILPLLLERLSRRCWRPDPGILLVLLVPVPLFLFMLYAHEHTGDAMAYFHIQNDSESYGMRHLVGPWSGFKLSWDSARSLAARSFGFTFTLEVLFGLLGVVLVATQWAATVWRGPRIAPSLALYSTGVLLPPLCLTFWAGVPRYLMTMVPIYILGADLLRRRPAWRQPVFVVSGGLMAFATGILATGHYLS